MTTPKRLGLLGLVCLLAAGGCGRSTADLTAQARSDDPVTRLHAVHALRERTGDREAAVAALVDKLKDENVTVRRDAARSLGRFGPDATEAVPHLRVLLRDRESSVRRAATQALGQIDPAALPPQQARR